MKWVYNFPTNQYFDAFYRKDNIINSDENIRLEMDDEMAVEDAHALGIEERFDALKYLFLQGLLMKIQGSNLTRRLLREEHKLWTEENSSKFQKKIIKEQIFMKKLPIICLTKGSYLLYMK